MKNIDLKYKKRVSSLYIMPIAKLLNINKVFENYISFFNIFVSSNLILKSMNNIII